MVGKPWENDVKMMFSARKMMKKILLVFMGFTIIYESMSFKGDEKHQSHDQNVDFYGEFMVVSMGSNVHNLPWKITILSR